MAPTSNVVDGARPNEEVRRGEPGRSQSSRGQWRERLRVAWEFRHPSLLPVVVLWLIVAIGMADYARAWSPTSPGLLGYNDWLVNYEGGFVRRGLLGQLLYWFHDAFSSTSLAEDLLVLQLALYAALAALLTVLALRTRHRLLPWVLLSPAAFVFSSYSVLGGYRKELVLLVGLGLIAVAATTKDDRGRLALCVAGAALFFAFVLSWEGGILFLPVVLLCLHKAMAPLRGRRFQVVAASLGAASVAAFGLEAVSPGSPQIVSRICSSLERAGIPYRVNCRPGGQGILGLAWLQQSLHQTTHAVANNWPGYALYLVLLAIGLAPFAASRWIVGHRGFTAVAVACALPLFVVASDYGRWIRIVVASVSIYWFMTVERRDDALRPRGALELAALTAWVACWSVAYWGDPLELGGLLGAIDQSGILRWFHPYG